MRSAVEGFERAVERALIYRDAGADVLFIEAPKAREELAKIVKQIGRTLPLMANMVEGGKTPMLSASELEALGFSLVIFPGGIVRTLAKTAVDYYASLAAHGTHAAVPRPHVRFRRAQRLDRHAGDDRARQAV